MPADHGPALGAVTGASVARLLRIWHAFSMMTVEASANECHTDVGRRGESSSYGGTVSASYVGVLGGAISVRANQSQND